MDQLNMAMAQMTSVDDLEINLKTIEDFIVKASGHSLKPEIIFFPENCLYMRVVEGEKIPVITLQDAFWSRLQNLCRQNQIAIHLGSLPLQMKDGVYNASVFVDDQGDIQSSYQKMHLFDIQLEGQKSIRESDAFQKGSQPGVLKYKNWSFGQSICYDIRFAELYQYYAKQEVDVILVPSAFLVKTGQAHWHSLLKARAIESQCYVVASAQAGSHVSSRSTNSRSTYGHALIVSPWGEVLLDMEGSTGLGFFSLQRGEIQNVRRQIPMKSHRRQDYFKS